MKFDPNEVARLYITYGAQPNDLLEKAILVLIEGGSLRVFSLLHDKSPRWASYLVHQWLERMHLREGRGDRPDGQFEYLVQVDAGIPRSGDEHLRMWAADIGQAATRVHSILSKAGQRAICITEVE